MATLILDDLFTSNLLKPWYEDLEVTSNLSEDLFKSSMKQKSVEQDLLNDGERESDKMKIPEILNGKVIHLEHQPALHRPIMRPEEDRPVLCRPIMHPEEDRPALRRPTMHPEEDQPALHRPTMHPEEDHGRPMHPEEDEPAVWVYRVNCASVIGISSSKMNGSGFMWDNMGHIVTNWHVIQNASDFRVTIFDRTTYGAKVIGFCKNKDVAVLRAVELQDKVKPISIGLCANLRVACSVEKSLRRLMVYLFRMLYRQLLP